MQGSASPAGTPGSWERPPCHSNGFPASAWSSLTGEVGSISSIRGDSSLQIHWLQEKGRTQGSARGSWPWKDAAAPACSSLAHSHSHQPH